MVAFRTNHVWAERKQEGGRVLLAILFRGSVGHGLLLTPQAGFSPRQRG